MAQAGSLFHMQKGNVTTASTPQRSRAASSDWTQPHLPHLSGQEGHTAETPSNI